MPWSVGRVLFPNQVGGDAPFPTIGNAVAVWVADDIAQANGTAVSSWVDRISGFTLAQASGVLQPVYDTTAAGGHPCVNFGPPDILVYNAANAISTALSGSVFAVVNLSAISASAKAIWASTNTAGTNNLRRVWGRVNTSSLFIEQRNNDTADQVHTASPPSTGVGHLIEWRSSGTAYAVEVDGSSQSLTVGTGANTGDWFGDSTSRGNFTVGGTKTTSDEDNYQDMNLSALVVVDGSVSSGERSALLAWAASRA